MNYDSGAKQVRSLAKSFENAIDGFVFCVKNERNMRIHLTAAFYVLVLSPFYNFTCEQILILLLTIGMVLFAEAVNTAIEALVNLQTHGYDQLARIAKDVAAGAVLICSVFAAVIGINLFLKFVIITNIIRYFLENWILGLLMIISVPAAICFICGFHFRKIKLNLKK